jgi:nitroimidazol reductase NimA-like FMN-containing flavoprotein (pyridoxamine 5'-phosphate oxidase superfamily)
LGAHLNEGIGRRDGCARRPEGKTTPMDLTAEPLELLRELFVRQRLGVLATHGEEHPYASLVAVRAADDLRHLYFSTTRATRKFQFLSAEPRVAMLVDSRSDDDLDFHGAVAATAVGTARELEGEERTEQLGAFLRRHPHLRPFASAPTSALVELTVETYYIVSRFQNVTELHLGEGDGGLDDGL